MNKFYVSLILAILFPFCSNASADINYKILRGKSPGYFLKEKTNPIFNKNIKDFEFKRIRLADDQNILKDEELNAEYSSKRKSLNLAIILGLIPINGLGHFYAEKYFTASVLFSIQLGSAIYIFSNVGKSTNGGEEGIEEGIADGVRDASILTLFWSITYLYDCIGAPIAVQKYNHELKKNRKANIVPYLSFNEKNNYLGISARF